MRKMGAPKWARPGCVLGSEIEDRSVSHAISFNRLNFYFKPK